ncbi:hypothetical protein DIPPA_27973 [Diplonema papillatum]|nr:hypothetical protein DIPPA_27973 [Diplonema papillatum]
MAKLVVRGLRRPRRRRWLGSLGADGFDAACEAALKYLVRHAPMDPPCTAPPEAAGGPPLHGAGATGRK